MPLNIFWLVVWNILYFPIYWVANHPNWLSYFSEGWPNHQPVFNQVATHWFIPGEIRPIFAVARDSQEVSPGPGSKWDQRFPWITICYPLGHHEILSNQIQSPWTHHFCWRSPIEKSPWKIPIHHFCWLYQYPIQSPFLSVSHSKIHQESHEITIRTKIPLEMVIMVIMGQKIPWNHNFCCSFQVLHPPLFTALTTSFLRLWPPSAAAAPAELTRLARALAAQRAEPSRCETAVEWRIIPRFWNIIKHVYRCMNIYTYTYIYMFHYASVYNA